MIPVTRRFALRGDCMLPLLEPGDEVWVRAGAAESGRLVAYARFQGRVPEIAVHRLLGDGRTRADARAASDPPDEAAALVGRVVALSRGGRLAALDSRRGRLWDAFALAYARAFLRWWREDVLGRLDGRVPPAVHAALRSAALAPARLVFRLLFGARGAA